MVFIEDVVVYSKDKVCYVVVKDFYKAGSAVCGFTEEQFAYSKEIYLRCALNAKGSTQVVALFGNTALHTYAEYYPYWVCEPMELVSIVINNECPGEPLLDAGEIVTEERRRFYDVR